MDGRSFESRLDAQATASQARIQALVDSSLLRQLREVIQRENDKWRMIHDIDPEVAVLQKQQVTALAQVCLQQLPNFYRLSQIEDAATTLIESISNVDDSKIAAVVSTTALVKLREVLAG